METNLFKLFRHNDDAISPVIGTILMVAATVVIGGVVYAAVNAYGGSTPDRATDASFRAQSLDTDNDGLDDTIKLTYLAGPTDYAAGATGIAIKNATGENLIRQVSSHANAGTWNPGDFETYKLPSATPGTVYLTVRFGESTILDQTMQLKE